MHGSRKIWCLVVAIMLAGFVPTIALGGENTGDNWLVLAEGEAARETAALANVDTDRRSRKIVPVELSVEYVLVSDNIFRGMNGTEYAGERHERVCHQLTLDANVDIEELTGTPAGNIGATIWFNWWGGYRASNGRTTCDNLQEVDYTIYWRNKFEEISTEVELGWIYYSFPRIGGDAETTYEVYAKLTLDDSVLFGTKDPVLSPYIYYGMDVDLADCGSWIEIGAEHEFKLADIEPSLRYMSITPSVSVGIDNRYLQGFANDANYKTTRLANIEYGLSLDYDLTGALAIPEEYGSVKIGGFVKFSDALREQVLNDEFYGGFKIGYVW